MDLLNPKMVVKKYRELESRLKEIELENEILKKFQTFLKENE